MRPVSGTQIAATCLGPGDRRERVGSLALPRGCDSKNSDEAVASQICCRAVVAHNSGSVSKKFPGTAPSTRHAPLCHVAAPDLTPGAPPPVPPVLSRWHLWARSLLSSKNSTADSLACHSNYSGLFTSLLPLQPSQRFSPPAFQHSTGHARLSCFLPSACQSKTWFEDHLPFSN